MAVIMKEKQRFDAVNTHKAIIAWFEKHKDDKPNSLRQNQIWQTIRCYVDDMGHYKAKTRGKHNINYLTKTTTINANKMYIPNE